MQFILAAFISAALVSASPAMADGAQWFAGASCTGVVIADGYSIGGGGCIWLPNGLTAKSISYTGMSSIQFYVSGGQHDHCANGFQLTSTGPGCATAPAGFNWESIKKVFDVLLNTPVIVNFNSYEMAIQADTKDLILKQKKDFDSVDTGVGRSQIRIWGIKALTKVLHVHEDSWKRKGTRLSLLSDVAHGVLLFQNIIERIDSSLKIQKNIEEDLACPETDACPELKQMLDQSSKENQNMLWGFIASYVDVSPSDQFKDAHQKISIGLIT